MIASDGSNNILQRRSFFCFKRRNKDFMGTLVSSLQDVISPPLLLRKKRFAALLSSSLFPSSVFSLNIFTVLQCHNSVERQRGGKKVCDVWCDVWCVSMCVCVCGV